MLTGARPLRRTLRFLAALGGGRPNSLFFAGDLGQRIFQTPFSWRALGVDVRGRSHTLRINYRTSHQIRRQADRFLPPELSDVDGNAERRGATVSVFNGPAPGGVSGSVAGLEFRAVAVAACDDDVVPLQTRIEHVGDDADLEEVYGTERHLLYVACTRARNRLLLTGVEPGSEFLDDLGRGSDRRAFKVQRPSLGATSDASPACPIASEHATSWARLLANCPVPAGLVPSEASWPKSPQ